MSFAALLVAAVLTCSGVEAQTPRIQGIRLAPSPLGEHAGRVEVRYNGRWGTICDRGWSSSDARVVCRMLGFSGSLCAVRSSTATFGEGTGPVWFRNVRCRYYDTSLDDCRHDGLQENSCPHREDAAVICQDNSTMPIPNNVTVIKATITSVTLSWMLDDIPPFIGAVNFKVYYRDTTGIFGTRLSTHRTIVNESSSDFTYTLQNLQRNRTYEVYVRADGEYLQWCRYVDLIGLDSESIHVATNEQAPPSTLPMRIIPVNPDTPYIGRLEVYHNGEWGTVCDDYFGQDDANVACYGLNYTDGALCYATSGFSRGTGTIWLDDVDCTGQERFEDCRHRGWGVTNCGHYDDVGLVCNPGQAAVPTVTNFRAAKAGDTYITLKWDPVPSFTGRYRISYQSDSRFVAYLTVASSTAQYRIQRLQLGVNYTIQISSQHSFYSYRGNCYYSTALSSDYSDPIYVMTQESAPDVSTVDFHISVLNRTAVEASWNLPQIGLNGRVTRFKIYVEKFNGSAKIIDVEDNTTLAYIITNLEPSAQYTFSMLITTVADGPRGILLTLVMPESGFVPTITQFGIHGDGIERVTKYTFHRGFNVLCSSSVKDITIYWQYANGSQIGIKNRSFREGHFENGTAVLQIGTGSLFTRYLTVCDGGIYTCVATGPDGGVHRRNFSLIIGSYPPRPDPPYVTSKGSTWVQIAWNALDCDGGYQINSYDVEYRAIARFSYSYTTAGRVSNLNYTIRNLVPNTEYQIRVQAVSQISLRESSSSFISVTTYPAGPSPPRSLSVKVTSSPEVCMEWREPATPNGVITLYKVYAEPLNTSRDIRVAVDLPIPTFVKTFHGSDRAGCMSVNETNVIYQIRMSAVAFVEGEPIEGDLSDVTPQSVVFLPKPGLPQVRNLEVTSATNTSMTLKWGTPRFLPRGIIKYNVTYSGIVQWTSNGGVFIQFPESGQLTTTNTNITISPLTPSTSYVFKVSVVTSEGQGAEVTREAKTRRETGDKLAYFQLKILNSKACEEWHGSGNDSEKVLTVLQQFLAAILNSQCKCGVTPSHIGEGEFSCRGVVDDSINYRARIKGTNSRSASDLVALIQSWVQSGQASVLVESARYQVDDSCNAFLDNIHALDCDASETSLPESPSKLAGGGDGASSAQVGGIIMGSFIAGVLLALLLVFIIAITLWKKKNTEKDPRHFAELVNEPSSDRASAIFPDDTTMTDKL